MQAAPFRPLCSTARGTAPVSAEEPPETATTATISSSCKTVAPQPFHSCDTNIWTLDQLEATTQHYYVLHTRRLLLVLGEFISLGAQSQQSLICISFEVHALAHEIQCILL